MAKAWRLQEDGMIGGNGMISLGQIKKCDLGVIQLDTPILQIRKQIRRRDALSAIMQFVSGRAGTQI